MTTVVKLGGTNGSGKTSVARALLDIMKNKKAHGKPVKYSGKIDERWWYILGSYENVCGGMDTISDKHIRLDMVSSQFQECDPTDVVFFEGLITGKTYGAFGDMSDSIQHKGRWIYAFMDTPFEVCVERVLARRQAAYVAKGSPATPCNPFNPQRTMLPTYKAVQATAKRAAAQGHRVVWLPHKLKPAQIAQFLINEVEAFNAGK